MASNPRDLSNEVIPADTENDRLDLEHTLENYRLMRETTETPGWPLIVANVVEERDKAILSLIEDEQEDLPRIAKNKGKIWMAGVILGTPKSVEERMAILSEELEAMEREEEE